MASRRDQLHSYQFMMQRVISSIMLHETDPEQTPLRRGVGAAVGGVMIAALVAGGLGVFGVISGSIGDRWRTDGAIVIERETGARYVFREGTLHPVLNLASARLVSGAPDPGPHRVPGKSLTGMPRGVTIGIPGAPDSLPPPGRVVGAPWTMCSVLGRDTAGGSVTITALRLGDPVPGGTPFADRGMLVRDSEHGTRYLIWGRHRYRLAGDADRVIRSLYGFQRQVVDAGTAWLNGLPAGADLAPIEVDAWGEPSAALSGHRVGDVVYHPVAGGEQHYLVRQDGLAHLTELQMLLLRGEYAVEPVEIPAAVAGEAPTSDALAPPTGEAAPPPAAPELIALPADGRVTLCAQTSDARAPPLVTLGGDLAAGAAGAIPTSGESPEGTRLADLVLAPPGRIAVVRALPSQTAGTGAFNLVTDVGLRFPVPSEEVLTMLGYSEAIAVDMPAALVQRIPAGPTLDPAAARQPAPVSG